MKGNPVFESKKSAGFGLNAFSENELKQIHSATLEVLWDVGIKVNSPEATEIYAGSGAEIERKEDYSIVRIPPHVVEESIRLCPQRITLYGRDPKDDYVVEPGRVGFTIFGENVKVNDLYTRESRPCKKKDLCDVTRVADALDEISIMLKGMGALEKPAETQSLHNYEAVVKNTSKHIMHGFRSGINSRKMVDMAAVCVGGIDNFSKRPCVSAIACPNSPLILQQSCCEVIIESAKLGLVLCTIPMPICGATAPATLAGSLVIQNAENLSCLVLAQLSKKGTHYIYGSCSTIMDMKIGNSALGAPEFGMLSIGATKLSQFYQIPNLCGSGVSDSKLPDAQSGYEFAMNTTLSALAGSNLIFSCGSIESGLKFDFAKLIMDAEHAQRVKTVVEGIKVTDSEIAVDVIKEVGAGGEFLTHDHTMQHMRNFSQATLFDRNDYQNWIDQKGGKDLTECAYEKAREILENHKPLELPPSAEEEMRSIIDEYEASLQ